MSGTIVAAVIGATATAISTASTMANEALNRSKSNLAVSIEVWNGTAYDFTVAKTLFRKGALFGGTEGTFIETPGQLSQQSFTVFSVEQVAGATTDVIGAVLFTSKVMDLLVGFHIYDAAGFQRYITSIPLEKGTGEALFEEPWGSDLSQSLNKYIWSGAGPSKSIYTTQNTEYRMFDFAGSFVRDVRERDKNGDLVATINGDPSIRQIDAKGKPSFASVFTGGGQIMKATISDDAFIDEIIDITGDWVSEDSSVEFSVTFVAEGIRLSTANGPLILKRGESSSNKYNDDDGGYYEFLAKIAYSYNRYEERTGTYQRNG